MISWLKGKHNAIARFLLGIGLSFWFKKSLFSRIINLFCYSVKLILLLEPKSDFCDCVYCGQYWLPLGKSCKHWCLYIIFKLMLSYIYNRNQYMNNYHRTSVNIKINIYKLVRMIFYFLMLGYRVTFYEHLSWVEYSVYPITEWVTIWT